MVTIVYQNAAGMLVNFVSWTFYNENKMCKNSVNRNAMFKNAVNKNAVYKNAVNKNYICKNVKML